MDPSVPIVVLTQEVMFDFMPAAAAYTEHTREAYELGYDIAIGVAHEKNGYIVEFDVPDIHVTSSARTSRRSGVVTFKIEAPEAYKQRLEAACANITAKKLADDISLVVKMRNKVQGFSDVLPPTAGSITISDAHLIKDDKDDKDDGSKWKLYLILAACCTIVAVLGTGAFLFIKSRRQGGESSIFKNMWNSTSNADPESVELPSFNSQSNVPSLQFNSQTGAHEHQSIGTLELELDDTPVEDQELAEASQVLDKIAAPPKDDEDQTLCAADEESSLVIPKEDATLTDYADVTLTDEKPWVSSFEIPESNAPQNLDSL